MDALLIFCILYARSYYKTIEYDLLQNRAFFLWW